MDGKAYDLRVINAFSYGSVVPRAINICLSSYAVSTCYLLLRIALHCSFSRICCCSFCSFCNSRPRTWRGSGQAMAGETSGGGRQKKSMVVKDKCGNGDVINGVMK